MQMTYYPSNSLLSKWQHRTIIKPDKSIYTIEIIDNTKKRIQYKVL